MHMCSRSCTRTYRLTLPPNSHIHTQTQHVPCLRIHALYNLHAHSTHAQALAHTAIPYAHRHSRTHAVHMHCTCIARTHCTWHACHLHTHTHGMHVWHKCYVYGRSKHQGLEWHFILFNSCASLQLASKVIVVWSNCNNFFLVCLSCAFVHLAASKLGPLEAQLI